MTLLVGALLNSTLTFSFLVIFAGCFTQSLTGFGVALVAMALLPSLLGLQVSTPLVALTGIVLEVMMLIRYRAALQFRSILGIVLASMIAIPFGIIFLRRVDEGIALFVLGIVITVYALYALIGFHLPRLDHPGWAWAAGLAGGLLSGAYNTSGPPIVVYGNCRRWSPQEFKSNLSGYFLVNSALVVFAHWVGGNITPDVTKVFLATLPALFMGFWLGQSLDRWINPETFRRVVLVVLVLLGIRLMI